MMIRNSGRSYIFLFNLFFSHTFCYIILFFWTATYTKRWHLHFFHRVNSTWQCAYLVYTGSVEIRVTNVCDRPSRTNPVFFFVLFFLAVFTPKDRPNTKSQIIYGTRGDRLRGRCVRVKFSPGFSGEFSDFFFQHFWIFLHDRSWSDKRFYVWHISVVYFTLNSEETFWYYQ